VAVLVEDAAEAGRVVELAQQRRDAARLRCERRVRREHARDVRRPDAHRRVHADLVASAAHVAALIRGPAGAERGSQRAGGEGREAERDEDGEREVHRNVTAEGRGGVSIDDGAGRGVSGSAAA